MGLNFQEIKCKNCGGNLNLFLSFGRATCEHCGTNYYVEGVPENDNSISTLQGDNPVNISRIILDSGSVKKYNALSMQPIRTFGNLSFIDGRAPIAQNIIDDIMEIIKYYSAVSYAVMKSCQFNEITFEHIDEGFIVDKKVLFKFNSCVHSFGPKNKKELLSVVEVASICNQDYIKRIKDLLTQNGFQVNDKIELCTGIIGIWYSECYDPVIPRGTYNSHIISAKPPVATPSYFSKFFPDIANKGDSLMNNNAIEKIASFIVQKINQLRTYDHDNISFDLYVEETGITWTTSGEICNETDPLGSIHQSLYLQLDFHQLSMEYIHDQTTKIAIAIALIRKIVENTRENGKDILELNQIIKSEYESFDYKFDLLEVVEKTYNSW